MVKAEVFDAAGTQAVYAGAVPNNQWTHVAMTYKAGSALVVYVNGVVAGRDTLVGASYRTNSLPINLYGLPGTTPIAGEVDELRVWNTARTAAEIAANKDRLVAPGTAGLVGLWSFDDGAGVLAADGSGNGNLAVVGGATWTERPADVLAPAVIATTAASVTAHTDRAAQAGVRYTYGVAPFDAIGAGVSVEDAGRRVLKAPSGLAVTGTPTEKTVALAWTDNSGAESRQRIVRTSATTTTVFDVAKNVVSFVDTTPTFGATYRYSVLAESGYGVSAASAEATGTTVLLPPASVSASDTYPDKVVVTWVDASTIETGYQVYRNGLVQGAALGGRIDDVHRHRGGALQQRGRRHVHVRGPDAVQRPAIGGRERHRSSSGWRCAVVAVDHTLVPDRSTGWR